MNKGIYRKILLIFILSCAMLAGFEFIHKVFKVPFPKAVSKINENIKLKYKGIKDIVELLTVELNKENYTNSNLEIKNPPKLIAHAAGEIKGHTYTNSLEALNSNYEKGHRFFEMDLTLTSDSQLVMIHGWDQCMPEVFGVQPKKCSLDEFKSLKMVDDLHQITFNELQEWIDKHQDAYIITDTKENNIEKLTKISIENPNMVSHILPQIYSFNEYSKVRKLGYNNIILTLYIKDYADNLVLQFVKNNKVMAVTMPIERAKTVLPKKLGELGVFTYAHTINDNKVVKELQDKGVSGFYTDSLFK